MQISNISLITLDGQMDIHINITKVICLNMEVSIVINFKCLSAIAVVRELR